jgi:hypothetical protein
MQADSGREPIAASIDDGGRGKRVGFVLMSERDLCKHGYSLNSKQYRITSPDSLL